MTCLVTQLQTPHFELRTFDFMKLSIDEVEHIATLSRLELSEEEKVVFANQLSSILEYVDKLAAVDTSDVEPMAHSLPVRNVFRVDEAVACDAAVRDALLDSFPDRQADLLKVKAVFS